MEGDISSADINLIGGEKKLGDRKMDEPSIGNRSCQGHSLLQGHRSAIEMGQNSKLKSVTYPQPRHVIESRYGGSLDCSLGHGELAGEAREGALASVPAKEGSEKVPGLHEFGAPRLVRSRRGQQPRGSRCLPRARLKQEVVHFLKL